VANEDELKAWAAGEDVEGALHGKGRSGLSASWFGAQAVIIAGGSLSLTVVSSLWWLLVLPVAALLGLKAVHELRKQATWERLYGQDIRE
jgi:hypothetical protein